MLLGFFFISIEFDKDSEFFAIAGVTKKIKVSVELLFLLSKLSAFPKMCICFPLDF